MTTPLGSAYRNPPGIRLDPERPDPRWRAPRPPGRELSGSLKFLAVVAALLLVVGLIWAAGGLEKRTDRTQAYVPGERIDVGSMEVTFDRAEMFLRPADATNKTEAWVVHAYGTATNTSGEQLLLNDPGVIGLPSGDVFGGFDVAPLRRTETGDLVKDRHFQFEPNARDVPIVLIGELPARWRPTGQLFVGMRVQTYAAHEADQGLSNVYWSNGDEGSAGVWVPTFIGPPKDLL